MKAAIALLFLALTAGVANAQTVVGDWQGTLKVGPAELRLVVHVARSDKGELTASMDSPDQGANGIPTTAVSLVDGTFKFDVPQIAGGYIGKLNTAGSAISGTWSQAGNSLPLDLARAAVSQARKRVVKGSEIDGDWTGSIQGVLEVIVHIVTYDDGMSATMDVPAQGGKGLPMTSVARTGSNVKFEMKALAASFGGTLDGELSIIDGTWSQAGNSASLVLKRAKK